MGDVCIDDEGYGVQLQAFPDSREALVMMPGACEKQAVLDAWFRRRQSGTHGVFERRLGSGPIPVVHEVHDPQSCVCI